MGDYGARVRSARKAAGLTLREVAERCAVDYTSLSHLEHGRFMPSVRLGQALSDTLGTDLLPPGELAAARTRIAALEAEVERLRAALVEAHADLIWENYWGEPKTRDEFRDMARNELIAEGLLPPA